jgi:hypothetical protein
MGNKQPKPEQVGSVIQPPKKKYSKYTVRKLALIFAAADYSQSTTGHGDLPRSIKDAFEMEMLLKAHGFRIKYNNLTVFDKFTEHTEGQGKLYAGTVVEKIESLLLKAR